MSEHHMNPRAVAKANGQNVVQLVDLGDGVGFAGFDIRPMTLGPGACTCEGLLLPDTHADGCPSQLPPLMVAGLFAIVGRHSKLSVTFEPKAMFLGEIGRVPLEALKRFVNEEPKAEETAA